MFNEAQQTLRCRQLLKLPFDVQVKLYHCRLSSLRMPKCRQASQFLHQKHMSLPIKHRLPCQYKPKPFTQLQRPLIPRLYERLHPLHQSSSRAYARIAPHTSYAYPRPCHGTPNTKPSSGKLYPSRQLTPALPITSPLCRSSTVHMPYP